MSTYAIGDVQGCFESLAALLARVDYRSGRDRVWLVGDLVNRGPASLQVLRWARREPGLVAVLGNHDLHLLALAARALAPRRTDTLAEVLSAPDRDDLIAWLRRRPLLYRQGRWVLVHAGVPPCWDLAEAERSARFAEHGLSGEGWRARIASWRWPPRPGWGKRFSAGMEEEERFALVLNGLTCMRCCVAGGDLALEFSGPPSRAPAGLTPWYELRRPEAARSGEDAPGTIVFGHWAALGLMQRPGYAGIDTGCVWGGALTALRLDDGQIFHQPALELRVPPA